MMRRKYSLLFAIVLIFLVGIGIYFAVPAIFGSVVAPLPDEYKDDVAAASKEFSVDTCLISAVIRGESNWNPGAGSHAGAQGLMQLLPGTASSMALRLGLDSYSRSQIKDPGTNIRLGTALLRYNLDSYGGTLRNALVAYNAGGGRVRLPDSQLPRETKFYIKKIALYYDVYNKSYGGFCTGPNLLTSADVAPANSPTSHTPSQPANPEFPATQTNPSINPNDFWKFLLPGNQ